MTLVVLTDDFHRQLDQGGSTLVLLLDLTMVFNMVNHDPLPCQCRSLLKGLEMAFLISPRSGTEDGARREALGNVQRRKHPSPFPFTLGARTSQWMIPKREGTLPFLHAAWGLWLIQEGKVLHSQHLKGNCQIWRNASLICLLPVISLAWLAAMAAA